tara:strand:- start:212 stop:1708 length:1497 start_codon:yes stop_codon:yes gene_type:complete
MKLFNILKNCSTDYSLLNPKNISIKEITTKSFNVKQNFIFVAIKGSKFNGEHFIKKILHIRNIVLLLDKNSTFINSSLYKKNSKSIIISKDHIALANEITEKIFPSNINEKVAVTGTNGKTSICEYTRKIWEIEKRKCASIGTLGTIFKKKIISDSGLTTPISEDLNKILNKIYKKKCTNLILEASSIGIDKRRLFPLKFEKIAFTNLSRDHLDYHKSMKIYKSTKLKLFKEYSKKGSIAILNSDDKESCLFYKVCSKNNIKVFDYGRKARYVKIESITKKNETFKVQIKLKKESHQVNFKCNSIFEIYNLICSLIIVYDKNLSIKHFDLLKKLKNPKGRIEKIYDKDFKIFVDYAHTPNAINNVLNALNMSKRNKLISIIGCGGERDIGKRDLMTKEALKFSDLVILADDNPRNEDPNKIRYDMQRDLSKEQKKRIRDIGDRKKAIQFALNNLKKNDILLIAGKGHEKYQIIKNKKIYFSDHETVNNLLTKKKNVDQ